MAGYEATKRSNGTILAGRTAWIRLDELSNLLTLGACARVTVLALYLFTLGACARVIVLALSFVRSFILSIELQRPSLTSETR